MKGISESWCLFCLQFSYEVKAMTSIDGRCNDYIQAKNSMRHDYDLLQKDHGKWHSKKGCKK